MNFDVLSTHHSLLSNETWFIICCVGKKAQIVSLLIDRHLEKYLVSTSIIFSIMEKKDTVDFASTNCSLRSFPNQKTFKLLWKIEKCLEINNSKPQEAKFNFSLHAGTCRLQRDSGFLSL